MIGNLIFPLFRQDYGVRWLKIKTLRIAWIVALGLAAWILSQLPLEAALQSVARLGLEQWLLWICVNLLVIALLVARWLALTRAMGLAVSFAQLLRVRQAGQLISFVTPGPQFGGEPLQVYWLWKRYKLPGHSAFLSVGMDRFFELWINFAVLLLAVFTLAITVSTDLVDWSAIVLILLGLLLLLAFVVWFIIRQPERMRSGIERLTRPWKNHPRLGRLQTHWSRMHESLQAVIKEKRPALGQALVLSLLGWVAMISEFWLLLRLVDVDFDLSSFFFLLAVTRLAFLLPLPGGIGSLEAGIFWAFSVLALPLAAAAGLIALMRFRDFVVLLAGALMLPGLSATAKVR